MPEPMGALTIKPPWSHAIAHGSKRVENRSWPAPAWAVGQDIAIHAGKSFDWAAEFPPGLTAGWAAPEDTPLGAVVAVARLAGCHDSSECYGPMQRPGSGQHPLCSPWAIRFQWHSVLADVRPLAKPVPCRGMLKLWPLPEDVESAARVQIQRDVSATPGRECPS